MSDDQSRPVPRASEVEGIDRALWALVEHVDSEEWTNQMVERTRDAILALVRPVEGVTETDIDLLHDSAVTCQRRGLDGTARRLRALAARLEASS